MNRSTPTPVIPKISEKTYALSQNDTYVFMFNREISKHDIKNAVENQFKVTVLSVKTANIKGKPKNTALKRRRPKSGKRKDIKKAYVTLKKGDAIAIFEESK